MAEAKNEAIPVEVIVKFNEQGTITPLKVMYADNIYVIDKVYRVKSTTPIGFYSMLEYPCLICGTTKKIYFDRYKGIWYVIKKRQNEDNRYSSENIEGC